MQAVKRYRKALEVMREYEAITTERGLVAEMNVGPNWGDPNILDRLMICLMKTNRTAEAIREAEKYFVEFPPALNLAIGKRIKARMEKLREKLHLGDE